VSFVEIPTRLPMIADDRIRIGFSISGKWKDSFI